MGLLFNNNKSTVPKGNELLKFILFWFPMETMQRETSPPSCVFVSTCPSAITTHWPISLSYDRGTTGSDIISFYIYFFFLNGQLWREEKLHKCYSLGKEWNKSVGIVLENLHETEATGKGLIHAHTFLESKIRYETQCLRKPGLTS